MTLDARLSKKVLPVGNVSVRAFVDALPVRGAVSVDCRLVSCSSADEAAHTGCDATAMETAMANALRRSGFSMFSPCNDELI